MGYPIHHELQVAEVTYAEAALATQREDGNYRTCQLGGVEREIGLLQFIDDVLTFFQHGQQYGAVVTGLPDGRLTLVGHNDELELDKCLLEGSTIDADHPLVVVVLGHLQGLVLVPVA